MQELCCEVEYLGLKKDSKAKLKQKNSKQYIQQTSCIDAVLCLAQFKANKCFCRYRPLSWDCRCTCQTFGRSFIFFVLFSAVTQDDGQLRLEMHRGCCHPPSPSPYLTTEVCASDTHRGERAARIQWNAIQKLWGSNEEIWHSCNINQCAALFLDWDRVKQCERCRPAACGVLL